MLLIAWMLVLGGEAVATTPHFAFYSDRATNLNDALLEAGRARNKGRPELFQTGEEQSCFEGLPPSARKAWDRAVGFYAEIISSKNWSDGVQIVIRHDLSGLEPVEAEHERRFLRIARGFMEAASPAYEACRWPTQDAANRQWVEALIPLLNAHADPVAEQLGGHYAKPLGGLPIRVDVVETVNWSGATTWILDPAGGHILISKEEPGPAALELVFHEASHTLMSRSHPVPRALARAAQRLDIPLPRDLWHAVLFYTTGEAVRRTLVEAGEPEYTPMMIGGNIFRRFHAPVQSAWPAYLNGERTLEEAAEDLLRSVHQ